MNVMVRTYCTWSLLLASLSILHFSSPPFRIDEMEQKLTYSGSDICTCRPYLIYGIEEAVKCAQRGGVGLIVYFRKEGRALGEVTKCMSPSLLPQTHIPTLPNLSLSALLVSASLSAQAEDIPTAFPRLEQPSAIALAPLEQS